MVSDGVDGGSGEARAIDGAEDWEARLSAPGSARPQGWVVAREAVERQTGATRVVRSDAECDGE